MFNIGAGEMIVIAIVLLVAVGPEQLPGVIRRVGKTVSEVRSMTDNLRGEFMAGMDEIERAADPTTWASSEKSDVVKPLPASTSTIDDEADDEADDTPEASQPTDPANLAPDAEVPVGTETDDAAERNAESPPGQAESAADKIARRSEEAAERVAQRSAEAEERIAKQSMNFDPAGPKTSGNGTEAAADASGLEGSA